MAPARNGRLKTKPSRNGRPKYQPLPDLPDDEYEVLKADIAEKGVLYAVLQDEYGDTIDGHQRERAADELGIKYPIAVLPGLSEEDKWHLAISLNVKRRHLTRPQMRQLVEQEIKRTPDLANNWLAEILGVDDRTVLAARKRLESTSALRKFTKLRGKDGKSRVAHYRQVVANTASELKVARAVARKLPPSCNGKVIDTTTASRRARRYNQEAIWEGNIIKPLPTDSIRLYHCPFQELREVAGLRRKSVHLLLTDVPYDRGFLPQLDDLGRFANEVLVDGGLFLTFCGQYYLDQYLRILGERLTYRWTLAAVWERDANVIHPLAIMSRWKPVLLFSKGPYRRTTGRRSDLLHMVSKEKALHDWQQPVENIEDLVKNFSDPGNLICDPCAGSGTTALACRSLSRRFVGSDTDEDCVAMAQKRLAEAGGGRRCRSR
jgi:hypothetical protein